MSLLPTSRPAKAREALQRQQSNEARLSACNACSASGGRPGLTAALVTSARAAIGVPQKIPRNIQRPARLTTPTCAGPGLRYAFAACAVCFSLRAALRVCHDLLSVFGFGFSRFFDSRLCDVVVGAMHPPPVLFVRHELQP